MGCMNVNKYTKKVPKIILKFAYYLNIIEK